MLTNATKPLNEISYENTSFLSASDKIQFDANGFLVYENLLTPEEITEYRGLITEQRKKVNKVLYGENAGQSRKFDDLLELRNAISHDSKLLSLMTHPKIFPIIVDLMGPNISLITSHIFYRPPTIKVPANFKQIDWHRDGPSDGGLSANGRYPWLYTKVGIFLTDLTIKDAGSLKVIPSSHLNDLNAKAYKSQVDPISAYEVKIPAGSVILFDNRILHAVGPNYSTIARENIYFGYGWRHIRPIDFTTQSEELLSISTPIQKQLFGEKTSDLGYYLPLENDVPLVAWQKKRLSSKSG